MKYGEFISVVQLGIGLHLGTAVLQLYGEFGVQPLIRQLERLAELLECEDDESSKKAREALSRLDADYAIFKIEFFHEFRSYVAFNSVIAAFLGIAIVFMSYMAQSDVPEWLTIVIVATSLLPAPITLGILWIDSNKKLSPIKLKASQLEKQLMVSSRQNGSTQR